MKSETTSTIERMLNIIELLFSTPDGLTAQEIQHQTDISRSTLFSLLRELKDLDVIAQNEARGRYQLGKRLIRWIGSSAPSYQALLSSFHQETKHSDFTESIALAVPAPQGCLVLDQVESSRTIRAVYSVGEPLPADHAAYELIEKPPTRDTIRQGYAVRSTKDRIDLALPICQDGVNADGILLCSAPAFRWNEEDFIKEWLPTLRTMAARLSYRLGAVVYSPFQKEMPTTLQATTTLEKKEIETFLKGPWAARLACVRPDGSPHVIPVWQEWDGEAFHILAWQGSQWAGYVQANPQVSLTVDEPWPPLQRVVARGKAVPLQDISVNQRSALLARMTERYLGSNTTPLPESQVQTIFRIRPETLKGWTGLPTGARKDAP